MMRLFATESYPSQRVIAPGYEKVIHFDGGHILGDQSLFALKLGFSAELYTRTQLTLVREIGSQFQSYEILGQDINSVEPRAYRVQNTANSKLPIVLLRNDNDSVSIRSFALKAQTNSHRIINADSDEVWYVYNGRGYCDTLFGRLFYEEGDYLFIPRSVPYRIFSFTTVSEKSDTVFIGIESAKPLKRPCFVQRGNPYNPNAIDIPDPIEIKDVSDEEGGFLVYLKKRGVWTRIVYAQTLFSCVGYDGELYPFVLHTKDISPPINPAFHTDPQQFATFITEDNDVAVSTFTPRWVHSLPYNHMNYWDECLLLAKQYAAHEGSVGKGDMTFHPQGFFHGPQFSAFLEWEKNKPEEIKDSPWHDDLAIMFESCEPLIPTKQARGIEIEGYWKSWIESWEKERHC